MTISKGITDTIELDDKDFETGSLKQLSNIRANRIFTADSPAITIASIDCVCHCEVASTVAISSEKARLLRFTRNDNSYRWIWVILYRVGNLRMEKLNEVIKKIVEIIRG